MGSNLKEIRRKISSVQNTQKTTKAMKLVSASKLKRAEEVAKEARIFASKLNDVFDEIVQKIAKIGFENIQSPLFQASSMRKKSVVDVIFITSDKGLCGAFNQATIKEVLTFIENYKKEGIKVRLRGIGKKGISYFSYNHYELINALEDLSSLPNYERSALLVSEALEDFIVGQTDEVIVVYNGFKTMISQELKVKKLLPFGLSCEKKDDLVPLSVDPEESEEEILEALAKKYLEYTLYYSLLDSLVAEHSARVQAMDAATNNAGNLVRDLVISYNKARQEAITTELVEINAGVEAMK